MGLPFSITGTMKSTTLTAFAVIALVPTLTPIARAAARPAGRTVTLTDSDNNKPVTVHPGDTLVVKLGSHADGGYTWNLVYEPGTEKEPPLLKFTGHTHAGGGKMPGDSGEDEFRFTVSRWPGMQSATSAAWLRLLDLRPWEPNIQGASSWQAHVTVDGLNR